MTKKKKGEFIGDRDHITANQYVVIRAREDTHTFQIRALTGIDIPHVLTLLRNISIKRYVQTKYTGVTIQSDSTTYEHNLEVLRTVRHVVETTCERKIIFNIKETL